MGDFEFLVVPGCPAGMTGRSDPSDRTHQRPQEAQVAVIRVARAGATRHRNATDTPRRRRIVDIERQAGSETGCTCEYG
jgi:hypothetical protein